MPVPVRVCVYGRARVCVLCVCPSVSASGIMSVSLFDLGKGVGIRSGIIDFGLGFRDYVGIIAALLFGLGLTV